MSKYIFDKHISKMKTFYFRKVYMEASTGKMFIKPKEKRYIYISQYDLLK